jgi:hypothetical protein
MFLFGLGMGVVATILRKRWLTGLRVMRRRLCISCYPRAQRDLVVRVEAKLLRGGAATSSTCGGRHEPRRGRSSLTPIGHSGCSRSRSTPSLTTTLFVRRRAPPGGRDTGQNTSPHRRTNLLIGAYWRPDKAHAHAEHHLLQTGQRRSLVVTTGMQINDGPLITAPD